VSQDTLHQCKIHRHQTDAPSPSAFLANHGYILSPLILLPLIWFSLALEAI